MSQKRYVIMNILNVNIHELSLLIFQLEEIKSKERVIIQLRREVARTTSQYEQVNFCIKITII